jgi:hypothetical protein
VTSNSTSNDDERDYLRDWLENSLVTHHATHNDDAFQVSQITRETLQMIEEEDEVDEETLQDAEADYRGTDGNQMVSGRYVALRSESYVGSSTLVSDEELKEYSSVDDLYEIPPHVRAAMHNRWRRCHLVKVQEELRRYNIEYLDVIETIKKERIREDLMILKEKDCKIIGMTTTAAVCFFCSHIYIYIFRVQYIYTHIL